MKGEKRIVDLLNEVLTGEITAASQYFLHAKMCLHWGYDHLGGKIYRESIDEMKHADKLVERILFLEGLPNLQDLDKLFIGEHVKEVLECDLRLEHKAVPVLRDAIVHCETVRDFVTRDLLRDILAGEEDHIDFLETQLGLIDKIGIENYIQLQSEAAG